MVDGMCIIIIKQHIIVYHTETQTNIQNHNTCSILIKISERGNIIIARRQDLDDVRSTQNSVCMVLRIVKPL